MTGSLACASDADVAAERFGGDAGGGSTDGERESLGVGRPEHMLAGFERDLEIAVDAAVPGGHGELGAGVGGYGDINVAGMRRQVVAARRVDDAIVAHVAARGSGAHEL